MPTLKISPPTAWMWLTFTAWGLGAMGWIPGSVYDCAQPDPLADSMSEIISHVKAGHKDALILLSRVFARMEA